MTLLKKIQMERNHI